MNRNQFLEPLDAFLDFFASCMSNLEVSYHSGFTRLNRPHRHFHATGVMAALQSYAWPAKNTLLPPPHPSLYDWPSTSSFLGQVRLALHAAIANGDEVATRETATKILKWGLKSSLVQPNIDRLNTVTQQLNLTWHDYLSNVSDVTSLATADTDNITDALIPYASSGTCKIHSLASTDGLIIFDSRVAAMLGECINEFLRRQPMGDIPNELRILVQLDHGGENRGQRKPMPLHNGANHRGFVYDHRWIECQVRASWIFEAALNRNPAVFSGHPLPERMHRLEAAAFMMGAYLEPGPFDGRSFNFARV